MTNKLITINRFTFLFFITLFSVFIFISPSKSFAKKSKNTTASSGHSASCLKLGQSETQNGIPQNDDGGLSAPCCKPLKDRETKDLCGIPTGGSYQYVCIACGDGKCDPDLENTCNCHEDCK